MSFNFLKVDLNVKTTKDLSTMKNFITTEFGNKGFKVVDESSGKWSALVAGQDHSPSIELLLKGEKDISKEAADKVIISIGNKFKAQTILGATVPNEFMLTKF